MIPYFFVNQIHFGPITIQVWGLFLAMGIIIGTYFATYRASLRGIKQSLVVDMIFWVTLASLVGAKIAFIFFHQNSGWSGFSSIGGILAGMAILLVFAKIKHISIASVLDILGPSALLVEGIGRLGCFILHEHLGKVTNFILGVNILGETRHDLGLYFSVVGFVGVLVVLVLEKVGKNWPIGTIGAMSMIWYFGWRFILEFMLEGSGPLAVYKIFGLTIVQIFSVILFTVLVSYLLLRKTVLQKISQK